MKQTWMLTVKWKDERWKQMEERVQLVLTSRKWTFAWKAHQRIWRPRSPHQNRIRIQEKRTRGTYKKFLESASLRWGDWLNLEPEVRFPIWQSLWLDTVMGWVRHKLIYCRRLRSLHQKPPDSQIGINSSYDDTQQPHTSPYQPQENIWDNHKVRTWEWETDIRTQVWC